MKNNLEIAKELCKKIYDNLSPKGVYPALTGGTLYKEGERKDIDILIYFKRQNKPYETIDLRKDLLKIGLTDIRCITGYVTKARYRGVDVDILNPETLGEEDYA